MKPLVMLPVDAPVVGGFKALYRNSRGELYEHPGIDQPVPVGTPVRLPAAGNWTIYGDGTYGDGSFGCCCVLDIPGTLFWVVLAHLQDQPAKSGVGKAGDVIGKVGLTGQTDGAHVHTGLSEERTATFAHNRQVDGAGVYRIGGDSPLRDPLEYLEPTAPAPYAPTLADVTNTLNNLNGVVVANAAAADARFDRIEDILAGIASVINGGKK